MQAKVEKSVLDGVESVFRQNITEKFPIGLDVTGDMGYKTYIDGCPLRAGSADGCLPFIGDGIADTYSIATINDINSDGFDKILVGNLNQANQLILSNGGGDVTTWTAVILPGGESYTNVIMPIQDINQDGYNDIVIGNYTAQLNQLIVSNGTPDVTEWTVYILSGGVQETRNMNILSDINGDGYEEILIGNSSGINQLLLSFAYHYENGILSFPIKLNSVWDSLIVESTVPAGTGIFYTFYTKGFYPLAGCTGNVINGFSNIQFTGTLDISGLPSDDVCMEIYMQTSDTSITPQIHSMKVSYNYLPATGSVILIEVLTGLILTAGFFIKRKVR